MSTLYADDVAGESSRDAYTTSSPFLKMDARAMCYTLCVAICLFSERYALAQSHSNAHIQSDKSGTV